MNMSYRRPKSSPKIFENDHEKLKKIVLKTMDRISSIVSGTMGPGGRPVLLESEFPGIPHTSTKDGVNTFQALGSFDPYEHIIIEHARDAAKKTSTEAGDGTTATTLLSYSIISNLFEFCEKNKKYSPQKATRRISKVTKDLILPFIRERSIKVTEENKHLLKMVATISANGDVEMANSVIDCFEQVGYADSSHVTIRQLSGPEKYHVERVDGLPIPMGFEESIGKQHVAFINDTGNQRCYLEKPLFLLYDGQVNDLIMFMPIMEGLGKKYVEEGNSDYKNIVIFSHGFSENVLTQLAFNFSNPNTMNILPMITPMAQFLNSQTHFLYDLAAFTGAKVFGLKDQVSTARLEDLGHGMENFEAYRFRSTVVGQPDSLNVEFRADELKTMIKSAESQAEKSLLEERLGKITNGIAKLTIFGGSNGELKEKHDRAEDAVLATRSTISNGALPGGGRIALDLVLKLSQELEDGDPAKEVLIPSLLAIPNTLLTNAGYTNEEIEEIISKLLEDIELVYDIENQKYGKAEELGLFDATKAVEEAINNAVSIASVLGVLGGIVAFPRDEVFERSEARADSEYMKTVENPHQFENEANNRP
jgi:chaperonin GroEL